MNGRLFRFALVLVALGALGLTGFAGEGRSPLPGRARGGVERPALVLVDRDAALSRLDSILAGLERLRHEGAEAERRSSLAGIVRDARRLRREIETAAPARPAREIAHAPTPLGESEFQAFLTSVRRASFADDRVALVGDQAKVAWFTSVQAAEIVGAIQSWGRVDAAAALFPRVVDPESFHLVYRELTFSSDHDELRERLEKLSNPR